MGVEHEVAIGRRDFLRGRFLSKLLRAVVPTLPAASVPAVAGLPPRERPPSAAREDAFLELCTHQGECVRACSHQAIALASPRFGRAAGTPLKIPGNDSCWSCAAKSCVDACKSGALDRARLRRSVW